MTVIGAGGAADRERLRGIAAAADGASIETIESVLPDAPARVLDLGCGNASLAAGLAIRRPHDTVLGIDRDVSLVPSALPSNLRIERADLTGWTPAAPFDLVHARFVLAHLADRDELLGRLASWLAADGHLVLTEPYQLSYGAHPEVAEVLRAYHELAEADGLSFAFARRMAGLLGRFGASSVDVRCRPSRLGGGAGVDRWQGLVERVADRLDVSAETLAAFYDFARARENYEIPQLIVTAIARFS